MQTKLYHKKKQHIEENKRIKDLNMTTNKKKAIDAYYKQRFGRVY